MTALMRLLGETVGQRRERKSEKKKKKTGADVLFKKATKSIWRSSMHVNWAVTLDHCQKLKEGKTKLHFEDTLNWTYCLWLKLSSAQV